MQAGDARCGCKLSSTKTVRRFLAILAVSHPADCRLLSLLGRARRLQARLQASLPAPVDASCVSRSSAMTKGGIVEIAKLFHAVPDCSIIFCSINRHAHRSIVSAVFVKTLFHFTPILPLLN